MTLSSLFNPNKLSSDHRKVYQKTTYTLYKSLILYSSSPYTTALFLFNTEVVKNVGNVVFLANTRRFDLSRKRQPVPQTVVSPRTPVLPLNSILRGESGSYPNPPLKRLNGAMSRASQKSRKNTTFPYVYRPLLKS